MFTYGCTYFRCYLLVHSSVFKAQITLLCITVMLHCEITSNFLWAFFDTRVCVCVSVCALLFFVFLLVWKFKDSYE